MAKRYTTTEIMEALLDFRDATALAFTNLRAEMDARFEQAENSVARRFQQLEDKMNRRFDSVDLRFSAFERRVSALEQRL